MKIALLMAVALLATASPPDTIAGDAAYNYRIQEVADYHGIDLTGIDGCAVLDCDRIGEPAWVLVDGEWYGPLIVVDCTAAHHRHLWEKWDRVVDLSWELWDELGLWLAPYPVILTFTEPGPRGVGEWH